MLNPGGNGEVNLLLPDRLDLNLGPHDRLGRCDLRCCLKVVSLADKPLVWLHRDLDEKVAIGSSDIPCFSVPFQPQAHPSIDAGRDSDGHLPLHLGDPGSPAGTTAGLRDLPHTAAFRAGGHPDKLAEDALAHLTELAAPPAAGTGDPFLGAAPRAVTCHAGFGMGDLDLPVSPKNRILKRDPEVHHQVGTRARA